MHADAARERILQVVRALPRGRVAAYGVVAARAQLPGRARLVARVLATSAEPGLPWHRVLRADGSIALPPGSAGWHEQVRRLREEGIGVQAGRVVMAQHALSAADSLDAALWAPPDLR